MTGFMQNYEFCSINTKKQIYEMLVEGFEHLHTLQTDSPFKVSVFRRDPIVPGGSSGLGTEIPCVAINRIADGETDQFIGDLAGYDQESGNQTGGRFFSEVFEIRVWATLAGMRDDIYEDLKRILLTGKNSYLIDEGAYLVRILNGVDEADHNFLPNVPMFWGTLQLSVITPLLYEEQNSYETIESIGDGLEISIDEEGYVVEDI